MGYGDSLFNPHWYCMILNKDMGYGLTVIRKTTCKDYIYTPLGRGGVCDSCFNCAFVGSVKEQEYAEKHPGWIKGIIIPKPPNRFEHIEIITETEINSTPPPKKETCKIGAQKRFAEIDFIMGD
jgi:hypothetical protein